MFHFTVFLGAYLLFLVQPLMAKQILPWFGGAPAVWSTCLLFFQAALVVGYAYAHVTRRLGARKQQQLHLTFLVLSLVTLPISVSPEWKPLDASAPVTRLLALLTMSVGAPYVMLSSTAPLLQDWYRRAAPTRTPYKLYALSNAGSLAALVSYPVVFERLLPVRAQVWGWSVGFGIFVLLSGWVARRVPATEADPARTSQARAAPVGRLDLVLWIALSACGSGLLLGVTNQLCQDVAVVPLLWIVPLAIYLLTFILCFGGRYARRWWTPLFALGFAASVYVMGHATSTSLLLQAAALLLVLAAGCMICHGELVHIRPAAEQLTAFYLAIAIGGSLGGAFVALAAPLLFVSYVELPLLLLLVPLLLVAVMFRDIGLRPQVRLPVLLWALPLLAVCVAIVAVLNPLGRTPGVVAVDRNFYGTLRVVDETPADMPARRSLYHGRVLHGAQFLDPFSRTRPTTYYGDGSGIAIAIQQHERRQAGLPMRIAVVGLGAGTIAAWGRRGDRFTFFELDPQVVAFARRYFTFLATSDADIDVVTGDARLSLEREMAAEASRHTYDVLAVDAFSGDSIPVHLLTREAFALYRQALAPDGVLALHVSNHYLDLRPVVDGLAADARWQVLEVERPADGLSSGTASIWMLATASDTFVARARPLSRTRSDARPAVIWTDAFSSLLTVLR